MDHVEEIGVEGSDRTTGGRRAKRLRVVVCGTGDRTLTATLLEKRGGFEVTAIPEAEEFRALVTAALTADVAIMLVDACEGTDNRTRRDWYLGKLLGIRQLVIAVVGLELVADAGAAFGAIQEHARALAVEVGGEAAIERFACVPLTHAGGEGAPEALTWYRGPELTDVLDASRRSPPPRSPFRFPVEWVDETKHEGLVCAGCVASGVVHPGDPVVVLPAGVRSRVRALTSAEGVVREAGVGGAITLTLDDPVDVEQGDLIASASAPAQVGDRFRSTIVWLADEPLFPGRTYLMRIGARTVGVTVTEPRYKVDPETFAQLATKQLDANDVGACNIQTEEPIAFDPHVDNRETGGFTLLDRTSQQVVGVGTLGFALWRSENVHWQALDVSKRIRSELKGQKPCVVWFTGLSGSGKSTIANLLEKRLVLSGRHTYLLDGDNVRHGLNKDLGFTDADRIENIRRVTEVSKLMVDAGLIVLVSFISPFRAERQMARATLGEGEFIEVFVDTPLAEAERRDPKGLYRKAREGRLKHFTGIDSPYEPPERPDIHVRTLELTPEESVELLITSLRRTGKLESDPPPAT